MDLPERLQDVFIVGFSLDPYRSVLVEVRRNRGDNTKTDQKCPNRNAHPLEQGKHTQQEHQAASYLHGLEARILARTGCERRPERPEILDLDCVGKFHSSAL